MNTKEALEILKRGAVDIISEAEFEKKLLGGKKLKIKFGADPTSADLHFGHSVALTKLRAFQDLGHAVILVIGDFTAAIGDPSGRDSTRPVLARDAILQNAKTYTEQAFRVLDPSKTEIRFNSEWLDPFITTKEILSTLSKITVSQVLEREDFKTRMKAGLPITVLEIMYSLFQGQDSVALSADVELGGTDQIFNLLVGRQLQKNVGQEPQVVMTVPLLVGTDGVKKMSKSYGNYIAITDAPNDMFGKTMSISDETMLQYYNLLTLENLEAVKTKHPMQAKKDLAHLLVSRFHGAQAAGQALENFEKVFSKKENPDDMPVFKLPDGATISAALMANGLVKSKNEARRLIDQGAVKLDGKKIEADIAPVLERETIMQVGKRSFIKLIK
jgi:tyrosyl-tRNA synthetase